MSKCRKNKGEKHKKNEQRRNISVVKEYVKNACYNDSTGHDWWHIQRVYNNAMLINKKENADSFRGNRKVMR